MRSSPETNYHLLFVMSYQGPRYGFESVGEGGEKCENGKENGRFS